MPIIGLDPSAQYHNRGRGGYIEAFGTWDIAEACKHHLEELWGSKCDVVLSRESASSLGGDKKYLRREWKALNAAGCDIAVSIHTDAGGGRGITCYKRGAESKIIGDALLEVLGDADLLPLRRKHPVNHPKRLAMLHKTNMPTVLMELGFHDSQEDMLVIGTIEGRQTMGRLLAYGIAKYYGWEAGAAWEVWRQFEDAAIECNVRVEDGVARADVRSLCEALGFDVWTVQRKIMIQKTINGGG